MKYLRSLSQITLGLGFWSRTDQSRLEQSAIDKCVNICPGLYSPHLHWELNKTISCSTYNVNTLCLLVMAAKNWQMKIEGKNAWQEDRHSFFPHIFPYTWVSLWFNAHLLIPVTRRHTLMGLETRQDHAHKRRKRKSSVILFNHKRQWFDQGGVEHSEVEWSNLLTYSCNNLTR